MTTTVRTLTRYSNGFVVYDNEGCVRTHRKVGHLSLAAQRADMPAPAPASRTRPDLVSASAFVDDTALEVAARNFCFWLEEEFMNRSGLMLSSSLFPIDVADMPAPEVVNLAVGLLRERGWVVGASDRTSTPHRHGRSGVVAMRLAI